MKSLVSPVEEVWHYHVEDSVYNGEQGPLRPEKNKTLREFWRILASTPVVHPAANGVNELVFLFGYR